MLGIGQQVDRYTIELELGRGAAATVYRVRHSLLRTTHALKVLHHPDECARARLLLEGQVQSKLQHPHVLPVRDVIELDGRLALVADFVDGLSLDAWVRHHSPDLETRLRLFGQVVAGVAAAHALGIIHRDLKPANVLVEGGPATPFARVSDFGLARELGAPPAARLTRSGIVMGTPAYMAPEQYSDARAVRPQADVFALGCVLYELVTDEQPFVGSSFLSMAAAAGAGRYLRPERLAPELSERICALIVACLQPEAARRPADAGEVLAMLEGRQAIPSLPSLPPMTPTLAPAPLPHRAAPAARSDRGASALSWLVLTGGLLAALGGLLLLGVVAWVVTPTGDGAPPDLVAVAAPVDAPPAASPPREEAGQRPQAPVAAPPTAPPTAPLPASGPAEAPAPRAAPPEGRVLVSGDAELLRLEARGQVFGADHLEPGLYRVIVRFPGQDEINAATVSVQSGETVTLDCKAAFLQCRRESQ